MAEDEVNIDETEEWENSIDKDGKPKFKFPLVMKPEFDDELDLDNFIDLDTKAPVRNKKITTGIVILGKSKQKNKGLF